MVYLCKYIYKWIKDFLSGRKQKVIINGKTSKTVNSHKWNSSGESECCRTNILLGFYKCTRPVYIQNMACVVTNEDMCSFRYLSVVHHRMRQTSSIALNERLKQTKNLIHNLIYIISA